MIAFVDTSALYAVLNRADANHERALAIWRSLLSDSPALLTSSYVVLETSVLLQSRLGIAALRTFHEDIFPLLTVEWVSEQQHLAAVDAVLTAARRKLSLVDCISFQTMRESGVRTAFCFDSHFREQGFQVIP